MLIQTATKTPKTAITFKSVFDSREGNYLHPEDSPVTAKHDHRLFTNSFQVYEWTQAARGYSAASTRSPLSSKLDKQHDDMRLNFEALVLLLVGLVALTTVLDRLPLRNRCFVWIPKIALGALSFMGLLACSCLLMPSVVLPPDLKTSLRSVFILLCEMAFVADLEILGHSMIQIWLFCRNHLRLRKSSPAPTPSPLVAGLRRGEVEEVKPKETIRT